MVKTGKRDREMSIETCLQGLVLLDDTSDYPDKVVTSILVKKCWSLDFTWERRKGQISPSKGGRGTNDSCIKG